MYIIFLKVVDLTSSGGTLLWCHLAAPPVVYSQDNSSSSFYFSHQPVVLWTTLGRGSGGFHHNMFIWTLLYSKGLTEYRIEEFSNKSRRSYFDFPRVPEAGGGMSRERGRRWEKAGWLVWSKAIPIKDGRRDEWKMEGAHRKLSKDSNKSAKRLRKCENFLKISGSFKEPDSILTKVEIKYQIILLVFKEKMFQAC